MKQNNFYKNQKSNTHIFLFCLYILSESVFSGPLIIDEEASSLEQATQLMKVSASGNISKLKTLIKEEANINAVSSDGESALMYAARNGNHIAVDFLLGKGAKINHVTSIGGNTALILAIKFSDKRMVELLLNFGANPNIIPNNISIGNPPALGLAVTEGKLEIVRLLLDKGARIRNALELSVYSDRLEIAKILLSKGATLQKNISNIKEAKKSASKNMSLLLGLDQFNGLVSSDTTYPEELDELIFKNSLVESLFHNQNYKIWKLTNQHQEEFGMFRGYQAKIAKNAIFARKGYSFKSKWLTIYFKKHFKEYTPKTKNLILSDTDKKISECLNKERIIIIL